MSGQKKKNSQASAKGTQKRVSKKTLWAIFGTLGVVAVAIIGVYVYNIFYNPSALFAQTRRTPPPLRADADATPTPRKTLGLDEAPSEEDNLREDLEEVADFSSMNHIVNVLLVGVDYAEERDGKTSGAYANKNFNSDVMMVLALDFEKNKATMVSIPRDTYAKIANADGKYKLNFSLSLGGGINDEGFMNVCKSVEWVLGGVPVDYYIGVTMPVVKELTDAIGGVEFYVDVPITIQGRTLEVGMQQLNGQQVLDYCRARKNMEDAGDANRVNRQKRMLLEVFKKLQRSTQIYQVPNLLMSMQGKVHTNLSFEQLAAMAVFGMDLDPETIEMETMSGTAAMIFNYGYVCTDQNKRVSLIKEIYGVDVAKQPRYAAPYAKTEWATMCLEAWLDRLTPIMQKDDALGEEERKIPQETATELNQLLRDARELYKKGQSAIKNDSATNDLANQITAIRDKVREDFEGTLKNAGYSMSWGVTVYTDGQTPMRE